MTAGGSVIKDLKSFYFEPLRGDRECLYGTNGKKILDFQCGINGHILGYNNSIVEKAIIKQIHKGFYTQSNDFINKEQDKLTYRLCKKIGFYNQDNSINGVATYFASSVEANQYAINIASHRYNTLCDRNYNEIICITNETKTNNQHTPNTNNKTTKENIGIKYIEYANISNIEAFITEHTSAVMLQPISWERDFTICSKECMHNLRKICSYHKIGLIIDETNVGVGSRGTMFAFQEANIIPDILTLSTGLAGGIPMSVCISNAEFSQFLPRTTINCYHNSTAIAIANALMHYITKTHLLSNIKDGHQQLHTALVNLKHKYHNIIKQAHLHGLIFAIQCYEYIDATYLFKIILHNGLSGILTQTNTICFFPPLNVSQTNLSKAINIIDSSINELVLLLKY